MLAADYNGWADTPEDEREALDALDLGPPPQVEPWPRYARALGNGIWRRVRKAA
jgi:hypothetical protein